METIDHALAQLLPDVIARFDPQLRYRYVSPAIERYLPVRAADMLGRSMAELGFLPEDRTFWENAIRRVFATARAFEGEYVLTIGRRRHVFNWRLLPELASNGRVESVLGISRDISEHRETEDSYRSLFEALQDGFALHQVVRRGRRVVDFRFKAVNAAFARLCGRSREELVGRLGSEVLPDTTRERLPFFARVAEGAGAERFQEQVPEFARHCEVMVYRPSPGRFATLWRDLSERRAMQGRLRQARRLEVLGEVAGGIAHDFRNVLQTVVGYADAACRLQHDPEGLAACLEQVQVACAHANGLVGRILAVGREGVEGSEPVDLGRVVEEILPLLRSSIPPAVRLETQIAVDCPAVAADRVAVHRVLLNLITNAWHAIGERPGTIVVGLACQCGAHGGADTVQLSVSDTGCGIPPDLHQSVFEPYFTTKPEGEGTGLGLATVREIVSELGGRIELASEPGQGTRFVIELPSARSG
ncbi:MAG: ATP-binding protein [Planctomycetota bacterium]